MERRQLNFNAPLLSARRFSSPRNSSDLFPGKAVDRRAPSGPNKSNIESDDILKPGAVPFHWEQTPGRPKNEPKARFPTQSTPRLPPGWAYSGEHPKPRAGRLSGPSKFNPGPNDQTLFSDHASLLENLHQSFNCKDEPEDSETESDEDTFSDAMNGLSLDEPCSVSFISGCQDERPSGTFSVDKQTRDFMMNRFLPAAKAAAALETPQYAAKKAATAGPTSELVVEEMKGPLVRKYGSAEILPYYWKDDEFGRVAVKKGGKSWGIIPRVCVKSTLGLLNQLPAMRSERRNAVSGPLDKNGRQLPASPKKMHHSGLLSQGGPSSSRDSPLRRYRSSSSRLSPGRNEPPNFLPKEIDTKIASSRKMFKALSDVSRNQAAEKTVHVDSSVGKTVRRMASSEYMNVVEGLGVKEEIEGFGGGGRGDCEVGPEKSPPPLPKSPSESWLWRTLPFSQLKRSGQVQVQGKKGLGGDDTKWETIVKSSNLRQDWEELMSRAPYKQSKTQ